MPVMPTPLHPVPTVYDLMKILLPRLCVENENEIERFDVVITFNTFLSEMFPELINIRQNHFFAIKKL